MCYDHLLSACAFCGSRAAKVVEIDVGMWAAACSACHSIGPTSETEAEAVRRWNNRCLPAGETAEANQ